ncbi:Dehydrogenase/reductase SDR member 7C-A, partial [Ilyodon furcidens]
PSIVLSTLRTVQLQNMALPSVMVLPLLIVCAAGLYYIYNEVIQFMSKTLVRNKVVVISDAVSGVGTECAHLFHKAGARLILCGTTWDKLESLYDSLITDSDPRE